MRNYVQVLKNDRLIKTDPVDFLWDYQWGRMGCFPGSPGWNQFKFLEDTIPLHKNLLTIVFDIEPSGRGIRFGQDDDKGRFWSSRSFLRSYGFSFVLEHRSYKLDLLMKWFYQTTDGSWDRVFSKAKTLTEP